MHIEQPAPLTRIFCKQLPALASRAVHRKVILACMQEKHGVFVQPPGASEQPPATLNVADEFVNKEDL